MKLINDKFLECSQTNFSRYVKNFSEIKNHSILRMLQFEIINNLELSGNTLDFGGGEKAYYKNILKCESYQSINIDPRMEPTWLSEVGSELPFPDDHFDNVISFNTFEHIYDVHPIFKALFKSLKDGGQFITTLPFLYPIHGAPDDYFRPTPSWFQVALTEAGFKEIRVYPLYWGPFSTGYTCSGSPGPLKKLRKHWALLLDVLYASIRNNPSSNNIPISSLGFFITAIK